MKLQFSSAVPADAPDLLELHNAAGEDLTRRFGQGFWSNSGTEKALLFRMRHSHVLIARRDKTKPIVGTLRLQTKKPWAIDVSYFTPVKKALYLTGMTVSPALHGKGIGRKLIDEAIRLAREWPADAIRLDAFDADAGAGGFYLKCGFREVAHVVYRKDPLTYFELLL